ncbi:MAG: phenylalanine--tRNA ligase subunit beta [Rickettsiales bacterium]|jgi:phenylalanyl-tRNA synthetase beta chain|nr:phenylalanine--tRNA ligase subunit beta [Rickettsiales bacterium]
MKWTYEWLKDYLQTDLTARQIADKLTQIGLEIENLSEPIIPIAAKIVKCSDIPDTHLHLLVVDDGECTRQIVCGAPNARANLVSALARPGCKIQDVEIKVGNFRGYESNGMMCSERELGIGDDHEGIVELDEKKYKIGQPLSVADTVFDAAILPNRANYMGVIGIARDLAAMGAGKFIDKKFDVKEVMGGRKAVIESAQCNAYNFAEIRGIKMAPSNTKIAARLAAIGINPKNCPVDATNYICFDLGQPLHCFDADEIHGDIVVRNAKDGEEFADLFDDKHILTTDDLVITDSDGILALAGVVGGRRGMTTDATKNIIIEAAHFDAVGTRKTRARLGISTDASYRFERGVDPLISPTSLAMAVDIIAKECGGAVVALHAKTDFKSRIIKYDPNIFTKKTGIELDEKTQRKILENFGYSVNSDWSVIVPSWRGDVDIPESLVADIIRVYGYDKIPVSTTISPSIPVSTARTVNEFFARDRRLIEHISSGLGNIHFEKLVSGKPNVKIKNPIVDTMNTARNSLIPNMLDAVAENEKRGYPDLAMFEVGTVFDGPNPGDEHTQVVIARSGEASPRHWLGRGRPVDVFDVKADLLAFFGVSAKTETDGPAMWAHPYRYGRLVHNGKILGEFGELHPKLARSWRIKTTVMIGLIEKLDDDPLVRRHGTELEESNFQPIRRDFSFLLEKEIPAEDIISAARIADPQIADVTEFDFYENNIAFQITIIPIRNMSDKDISGIQDRVIAAIEKLGARIRDK